MNEIRQLNGLKLVVAGDTIVEVVFQNGDTTKPRLRAMNATANASTLEGLGYDEVAEILTESVAIFHKTGHLISSVRTAIENAL